MLYDQLIETIENTHVSLRKRAISSINQQLVIRNWLIGFYIVEFEQHGEDRAMYGTKLVENIAKNLRCRGVTGLAQDRLWLCRQFYTTYTHFGNDISSRVVNLPILVPVERELRSNELMDKSSIGQPLAIQLQVSDYE